MNFSQDFKKYANSMGISSTNLDEYQKLQNGLTPYVIEERQMNMTQIDVFSRLLMDRLIFVTGPVNQQMCDIIQAQLLFLESLDPGMDIKLYLNSPGGSVSNGLSIVDVMNYIAPDIQTVNVGMCASMGSILLGAGTKGKRFSLPFSKVMIHQVSSGAQGHVEDNRISHMEAEKYNYILFKMLSEYTGTKFEDILEMANRDKWLNSKESLELGIIDEILIKEGHKPVEDYLKGFDKYYQKLIK
jgi:ATP-dependent Clp protease protease subunit